jgi:carboxylesterase type B
MSEDCLYLNIFSPLITDSLSTDPLPVMIFIHGGGFQFGYASDPNNEAEHFVNTTNVIVVFVQYRLGKDELL